MTFITSCTNNYFEYVSAFSYKYLKITILFLFIHENTLKHPGSNKQSISKPSRNFLENKRPEKEPRKDLSVSIIVQSVFLCDNFCISN
jgi:hypothetical protein